LRLRGACLGGHFLSMVRALRVEARQGALELGLVFVAGLAQ